MIFKAIKSIKNKAIRIGVIWFIFSSLVTVVIPTATYKIMMSDYYYVVPDPVMSLLFKVSDSSILLSWPSDWILDTARKEQYIGYLDEYNELTSAETSEENKFLNMTEEKVKALNEEEFSLFTTKLYDMDFDTFLSESTYYSVMIFSCALNSFILYLILSFFLTKKGTLNRVDRD